MEKSTRPLSLGAVLFPGFELLDVFGPLEMFGLLRERVSIVMLAEKAGLVASHQGPKAFADLSLAEADQLDLLLIPGGRGTRIEVLNARFLELLRSLAGTSHTVACVCTGSALLAKTGSLDGRKATTNKHAFEWVRTQGPNVNWIRRARWVEDGKYFTSSSVSAGIDMSLGVIQHLFGRATAVETAHGAEYLWNDEKSHDPFA